MNVIYTNGENKDFILLCRMLDESIDEIVGDNTRINLYAQYNLLNHIHDVFLCYDNDIPVACASYKNYDEGVAEVKRVFVRKDYRGRGLSKLLMEQLEAKAKEQGYKSLILETGKPLEAAFGLYSKLGFRVTENYGQYKDMPLSICMIKDITE